MTDEDFPILLSIPVVVLDVDSSSPRFTPGPRFTHLVHSSSVIAISLAPQINFAVPSPEADLPPGCAANPSPGMANLPPPTPRLPCRPLPWHG